MHKIIINAFQCVGTGYEDISCMTQINRII